MTPEADDLAPEALAPVVPLTIKQATRSGRKFSGFATTPALDSHDESIDPFGLSFANPVPLLLNHDQKIPIGSVTLGAPTALGVPFDATIPEIAEAGALKDLTDLAAHLVANSLIRHVSIGLITKAIKPIAAGVRILKGEIRELSLVAVPSNLNAAILSIKSASALAVKPPAASGPVRVRAPKDAPIMAEKQFIPDAIKDTENHRAATHARMLELMTKAHDTGETLDGPESEEYEKLGEDLAKTDTHLGRLRTLEASDVAAATPINTTTKNIRTASDLRGGIVTVKSVLPKATGFTRMVMAMAEARGDYSRAIAIAEKRWNDTTPEVALALKAAIAPGNTTDAAWAAPLVNQTLANEFLELLRPATILGKIANLRKVPFNVKVPLQTLAGVYGWVGEGAPKPVTKLGMGTVTLGMSKAAGIITLTEELVRTSSPSAEEACRRDMIAGIAAFLDQQFIDPAVAEVVGVHPASITNGAHTVAATADGWHDIQTMIATMIANKIPIAGSTLIMSASNAFSLGLSTNALGQSLFPNLNAEGGMLPGGINVVTSETAAAWVVLLQPNDILYADEGGVTIDVSREASVQMDSAPDNPALATTVMVSLWQNNLVGLRAERFITWKRARTAAVEYLTAAAYVPVSPAALSVGGASAAYASAARKPEAPQAPTTNKPGA